jgi:hypothetical protein
MQHPAAILLLGMLLGALLTRLLPSISSFSMTHHLSTDAPTTTAVPDAHLTTDTKTKGLSLGDGCRYVFLDLGANVGVQARKLYEQEKYKNSAKSIMNHFSKHFGTNNRGEVQPYVINVCVT